MIETVDEGLTGLIEARTPLSCVSEVKHTLGALMYKSVRLQQKHICTNICQIVTPLLCILFTLAVRAIVTGITTGIVKSFSYPVPFNLPILNIVTGPVLSLQCKEAYYYEDADHELGGRLLELQLKSYCEDIKGYSPEFIKKEDVNIAMMGQLELADKEQFERGNDLKTEIADGMIKLHKVGYNKLSATLAINDLRLPEYHLNNGVTKIVVKTSNISTIVTYLRVTEGIMSLMEKITRAYLQTSKEKEIIVGSYMYMPFQGEDKELIDKTVNMVGSGLYPLGLSLLLPLFLYTLLSEKEEKILEIMKMNGLNLRVYWLHFFLFCFLVSLVTSFVFFAFGRWVIEIDFFVSTSSSVLWAVFIAWNISQISLTTFVQIFINSSRSGTIIGYLLSIFSTLIGVTMCTVIFPYPIEFPLYLMLYPPFALCRAVYMIGTACSNNSGCYGSLSIIDDELWLTIVVMCGWGIVFIMSIWLNDMVSQRYGVTKRPKLIKKCVNVLKYICHRRQTDELDEVNTVSSMRSSSVEMDAVESASIEPILIDESVYIQETIVKEDDGREYPLMIRNLSKRFTLADNKEKEAFKRLSLRIEHNEIFGLVGPNGAGKTTLISVLTGMYEKSSGEAWIGNGEIGTTKANKLIGVCPQFDLLWGDLTVEEHLTFYAKLKNIDSDVLIAKVSEAMDGVDLSSAKDTRSRYLSGGMQRRLSIAIALLGDPKIVFLDEPSSGLDPYHRREIWNILLSICICYIECKKQTSIFLTTHLMDEVEALCDRVGIIDRGQLYCVGTIDELKAKFGKGYRLTISYSHLLREGDGQDKEEEGGTLHKNIIKRVCERYNCELVNELETRSILKIKAREVLPCIHDLQGTGVVNWSVSQPSLYDVFINFIK